MFVLGNFLNATAYLVNIILDVMSFLIVVRAILSWFSPDPFNPLVQFLNKITEPILEPVRRLMPPMGFDISPIIVLIAFHFLKIFLVSTLYDMAMHLR